MSILRYGWLFVSAWVAGCAIRGESDHAIPSPASIEQSRFARFESFQIRGVCNDYDLDRLSTLGVNTVRGYTIPSVQAARAKLDHAHRLGMKVILGEWMPHQGDNKGQDGVKWTFDYNAKEEELVRNFVEKVEGIGDHPAILMWSLGNEVHLDEPYLRTVNRMSKAIHERFPHHITSLTMVNAKQSAIEAVKKFAPDIDVLGIQSYSRGAVRGAIRNTEKLWGKRFYMSEFNTNGPWNLGKAPWGVELEEPVTNKVRDLKDCYKAIDESPLSLGSTIFVWGHYPMSKPSYFSLLLEPDIRRLTPRGDPVDHLYFTPQAEVMVEHFTGKPIQGNRAPVISKIEFEDGLRWRYVRAGESFRINLAAEDADGDTVEFVTWIQDSAKRAPPYVAGPYSTVNADHVVVTAPDKPGEYLATIYALDRKGGGSASAVVFKALGPDEPVPTKAPSPQPTTRAATAATAQ